MDNLPEKVKRIDVLRVEYGKKKLCQCSDPHYEIDYQNRLVYCADCGAIVDPFEALVEIAESYDRIGRQIDALLEQRREIASYKPHLVVIKELERLLGEVRKAEKNTENRIYTPKTTAAGGKGRGNAG